MESKKIKVILFEVCFFLLLMVSLIGVGMLYENKIDLEEQISKRDELIRKKEISDSILLTQSKNNTSIVEKYISDCGILINNKKVTTDELIQFLNSKISEINSFEKKVFALEDSIYRLQNQINNEKVTKNEYLSRLRIASDSLAIYKSFYNLAKKNLNTDFTVNGKTLTINIPKDTLSLYKTLYEMAKADYGISYAVKEDETYRTITRNITRADSALMLFKYYGDKITRDSSGKIWYIETPIPKKKKKDK
ncbi:MAG: hypothetical protein ACOVOQ_11865 [Flavobacterium sp.]